VAGFASYNTGELEMNLRTSCHSIAFTAFLVAFLAASWTPADPPRHAEWELTFQDDFNGTSVNWDVWQSDNGSRGPDKPEGRWPENNLVKDGILYRVTRKENPPRGGKDWSSAHIWTRTFEQQYGYFEARMKYGRYLNNAFWLFRPLGKRFPNPPHFEIDINEGHTPRELAMTLHFYMDIEGERDHFSSGKTWNAPMDLDADFHLYGCEWNEKEVIWYFDGQPVRRLQHPFCHATADMRLSTVIMPRQLEKDKVALDTMDGVSMAVDWVRVYRKKRDLAAPNLPELEKYEIPKIVKREPQVALTGKRRQVLKDDFESAAVGALPPGWEVGDGEPVVAADAPKAGREALAAGGKALKLAPNAYAFRMLDGPVTGRLEVEFDFFTPRGEGLLFTTLGRFDKANPELRKTSYYTGDIGPYINWMRAFMSYYTEQEKWQPFASSKRDRWLRARFLLDIPKGAFDYYAGKDLAEFQNSGPFRGRQKAAHGIALRHRGTNGVVYVDNIVVSALE